MQRLSRRELIALLASAPVLRAARSTPASPVAIGRCPAYGPGVETVLATMMDQLGGLSGLVANKTVTVKLNLTGSPGIRFQGKAPGLTHYVHPTVAFALVSLLDRAGARRIRLVESGYATNAPLEEYLLDSGWNVRALRSLSKNLEFEDTNFLGSGKTYHRFPVPGGGAIFPAYDLNHSYADTDVFVSLAKLKNHATCGVTLSIKNLFGITPASIYGDDAGVAEPNENPGSGRVLTCHEGKREPSKSAPQEINPASSRDPGHRMPRIVSDLAAARPVHLAIIDGVETLAGGEGPWIRGIRAVKPGLLIAGTNSVNTDTIATAAMGYDPRATRGAKPFLNCDNTLLLAEGLGIGSASLRDIEVRGLALHDALYSFG